MPFSVRVHMLRSWASDIGLRAILLFAFLVLSFGIVQLDIKGKEDARDAALAKRQIEFLTKDGIKFPSPLYFLVYTEGKYMVYAMPEKGKKAQVYIINDSDVRGAIFVNQ
ncbi:MAG TPA: hypothetical protein VGC66_21120 [Pyrinomonadaceae bacterium]